MYRIISTIAWLCCALAILIGGSVTAAPLPPELNVVPRDAAMFASIRVADLWNAPSIKPIRDYIAKDARILRDFENETGFKFEDLERATFFIAGISGRGPTEPCVVLTFAKPYRLEKILDTFGGMTPAEYREFEKKNGPRQNDGFGPPRIKIDKRPVQLEIEKEEIRPDLPPLPKEPLEPKSDLSGCGDQDAPPVAKGKEGPRDLKASYFMVRHGGFLIPINERTILMGFNHGFGERSAIPELLASLIRNRDSGPLSPALEAAAGKHMVVAGVNLPVLKNAIPKDSFAQALPIDAMLSSQTAILTADVGDELVLSLRVDSIDEATSKRVHDVMKAVHVLVSEMLPGLNRLTQQEELREAGILGKIALQFAQPLIRSAQFEQKGTSAVMSVKTKTDAVWSKNLTDTLEQVQNAAERARMMNNMKQIGLGAHSFQDTMGMLPFPGVSAPKGQPQNPARVANNPNLSWRVAMLPFIEQQNLYNEFRFDEPWDSAHNKKLIPRMPKIYAPPRGINAPEGHTFVRCFSGKGTISEVASIQAITDGSSNTVMVVDAAESVPWTKPEEIDYDGAKPLPKLGGHFKGLVMALFGDGTVRMLDPAKVGEKTMRLMITANDGEAFVLP